MAHIGELKKQVTIQNKTITKNTYGEQVIVWATVATVFAKVQLGNGREFWAAQKNNSELDGIVTIWYRKNITSDMRIVYGKRNFEISKPPINIDEKNEFLELHVKEVKV